MPLRVLLFVCVRVCACVCICACMRACMCVCVCVCVCARVCAQITTRGLLPHCVCVRTHAYLYVCARTHMCVCAHTCVYLTVYSHHVSYTVAALSRLLKFLILFNPTKKILVPSKEPHQNRALLLIVTTPNSTLGRLLKLFAFFFKRTLPKYGAFAHYHHPPFDAGKAP